MNILDYLARSSPHSRKSRSTRSIRRRFPSSAWCAPKGSCRAARAQGVRQARHHREEPAIPSGRPAHFLDTLRAEHYEHMFSGLILAA